MDYLLKRWRGFARFLDEGRVCLTNNAAERALRGIALGRRSWLSAGSDRAGDSTASPTIHHSSLAILCLWTGKRPKPLTPQPHSRRPTILHGSRNARANAPRP